MGSIAIGAAAGAAGFGAGGLVGGVGFWAGAGAGALGGGAGGFVGGAVNACLGGASFSSGLGSGLQGAGWGALTGGAIGGVAGGINSLKHGGNFWTGQGAKFGLEQVGSAAIKKGDHFLDEEIPAGAKSTDSGEIARTNSNHDYGEYGWTRTDMHGHPKMHKGVDYAGKVGDNVYAMYDGNVTYSGYSKSYGANFVRTSSTINGRNYFVDYGHMSKSFVNVGNNVSAGQKIGLMGRLGNIAGTSYPTHVHISVWRYNNGFRGFVKPWWE